MICISWWFKVLFFLFQSSRIESARDSPVTPPLSKERLPRHFQRPVGMGYSSSDSLDHHPMQSRHYYDAAGLSSTPKLSSINGAKTETSSVDGSVRTSSSREADRSGELSVSNASDVDSEWVEPDEPGVYITIRALPGGARELRRVRFRYVGFYTVENIKNFELLMDMLILCFLAYFLHWFYDSLPSGEVVL